MTPSGIEPTTYRLVAQRLNLCATAVPHVYIYIMYIYIYTHTRINGAAIIYIYIYIYTHTHISRVRNNNWCGRRMLFRNLVQQTKLHGVMKPIKIARMKLSNLKLHPANHAPNFIMLLTLLALYLTFSGECIRLSVLRHIGLWHLLITWQFYNTLWGGEWGHYPHISGCRNLLSPHILTPHFRMNIQH